MRTDTCASGRIIGPALGGMVRDLDGLGEPEMDYRSTI